MVYTLRKVRKNKIRPSPRVFSALAALPDALQTRRRGMTPESSPSASLGDHADVDCLSARLVTECRSTIAQRHTRRHPPPRGRSLQHARHISRGPLQGPLFLRTVESEAMKIVGAGSVCSKLIRSHGGMTKRPTSERVSGWDGTTRPPM